MENEINNELEDAKRICEKNGYALIKLNSSDVIQLTFGAIKSEGIPGMLYRVAKCTGLKVSDIHLVTRKREIVQARQMCHYLAKKYTGYSLASIGRVIGEKDHASVLNSVKTVQNLIDTDFEFKEIFKDIIIQYRLKKSK